MVPAVSGRVAALAPLLLLLLLMLGVLKNEQSVRVHSHTHAQIARGN
jgi:hypothetical protein